MTTPLPPDPYVALGLSKDATPAQIKTTYRKLVLKCHPDKVMDESKKAEASDQFHRIQTAYEILSDEGRRSRYDAQIKMAELRKQNVTHRPTVDVRTAAYEMPTSSPGRATFTARGPERVYEEHRPERSDSDDYFGSATRTTSRKHDDYERQSMKKTAVPPKDNRERDRVVNRERRESERASRTDKRKTRDQDTKRDRDWKYSTHDDDSGTDLRYEAERLGREKELQERPGLKIGRERERERDLRRDSGRDRDEHERERERALRRGDEERAQYYSYWEDAALAHQERTKRPSFSRSASTANKTETYIDRIGRPTPVYVRRHSAKPVPVSPQSRRERDRRPSVPDIVETEERRPATRPPPLYTSTSSPSAFKLPPMGERSQPLRSASMKVDDHAVPRTPISRAHTMPDIVPKRAKDSKPSTVRDTDFSSGQPAPSVSPDFGHSPTTHKYRYSRRDASSSREDVDYRHPADYERERPIHRSPEPMHSKSSKPRSAAVPQPSQPPPIRSHPSYSSSYTIESPTSHTRPSPVRRDTQRDYDPLPKASVPKANSSAKYECPHNSAREYVKDRRRPSPTEEYGSYSSHRASASATRPHLPRPHTSDYIYAPRTQVA